MHTLHANGCPRIELIRESPEWTCRKTVKRLWRFIGRDNTLASRIRNGTAHVIHVPFKQEPLADAVSQFSFDSLPTSGLSYYSTEAYASFGVVVRR